MTALDLEFERALYYHNEGYDSDNDQGEQRKSCPSTKQSVND